MKDKLTLITFLAIIYFFYSLIFGGIGGGSSTSTNTCLSCDRTYADSANKRSIRKTNMCQNCYSNYKWASSLPD